MHRDRPSRTAFKVAQNIIALGSKPGMDRVLPSGIVEATERILVASGVARERTVRWSRSRITLAIFEWFDWLLPGQFEAFAHRKAFCERQVRAGVANGATQVLVLGAGYDMLTWRLAPEFTEVQFFEVDHPATANLKANGIREIGRPDNLNLIPEDLGETSLVDLMRSNKVWDQSRQTVVIAEGLLMYLSPQAVKEVFRRCHTVTGPESRIAFTYVSTGEGGRPDAGPYTGFMLWSLKVSGEPWLWSIRPEELEPFLRAQGWSGLFEEPRVSCKHGVEFFGAAVKHCKEERGPEGDAIHGAP